MTDMTSEIPGPKQTDIVSSPEPEHSTPIVVLYRGSNEEGKPTNPFMKAVAAGLKQRGLNVVDRPIDPEVVKSEMEPFLSIPTKTSNYYWAPDDTAADDISAINSKLELEKKAQAAIGQVSVGSVVITDLTLQKMGRFLDGNSISVYENLWELGNYICSVVEAIRKGGRQPVTLTANLVDHSNFKLAEEEKAELRRKNQGANYSGDDNDLYYALALKETLDVPIVSSYGRVEQLRFSDSINLRSVRDALIQQGINPDKAVLLVDHHLYNLSRERIKTLGLDQVEIATICPCCIGLKSGYKESLKELGYRLYPVEEHMGEQSDTMQPVLDKLVSQIQERQAAK